MKKQDNDLVAFICTGELKKTQSEIDRIAKWARAKEADSCWELHSSLNKLIADAAYDIADGSDPGIRKRQLCAEIETISKKYLQEGR